MLIEKLRPAKIVALGLILVAAANVAQWYLQRHSGLPESTVDFASGAMQGAAICTLLIGIVLRARERRAR
jgi:hypothetical protein